MSVILRNIQIPLFIKIETGCLQNIRQILDEHHLHFQKPLVLSEEHILALGGNDVVNALGNPATVLMKENSIAAGDRLAKEIREKGNDLIVSVGGGRTLDLGKYAATKAGVNYISIPTSPSNDGICSPVAVLTDDDMTKSLPVNMPIGIFVDTSILTSAPIHNIRAGIGDLISNMSAINDWRLAYHDGKESMDDFAASIAFSAAQLIHETCRGVNINISDEAFLEKLVHGLILSGIAMNIAGNSRPCSGSEHEISHAIDALFPGRSIHGLQVSYGTLLGCFLRKEEDLLVDLVDFFARVELPATHQELGLTDDEMIDVFLKAPETRPERYTILEKLHITDRGAVAKMLNEYNAHIAELQGK